MKYDKGLAWIAAVLMALSLAGCQTKKSTSSVPGKTGTSAATDTTEDTTAGMSGGETGFTDPSQSQGSADTTAPTKSPPSSGKSSGSKSGNGSTAGTSIITTKRTGATTTAQIKYPNPPNSNFVYQTSKYDNSADMKFLVPVKESFSLAPPKSGAEPVNGVYNARDFGATANDLSDDADALNEAFSRVGSNGVLYIPGGLYIINKPLSIPSGAQVVGDFTTPGCANATIFLAYYGHGDANKEPLITMGGSSVLQGIEIYYPKQDKNSPVAYPATIKSNSPDTTIDTVFAVNPYVALDFKRESGRHYIRNFYSQPLKTGLMIDNCLDVGRLRNIHFRAYWSKNAASYQRNNAVGIEITRSDWQYVDTVYMDDMKIGWNFLSSSSNVLLNDCVTSGCVRSVNVEDSRRGAGVIFSKCTLDGQFYVKYTNAGSVTLQDCVITANKYNATPVVFHGLGTCILRKSVIDTANGSDKSAPALLLNVDQAIVSGNTFSGSYATHIKIDTEVKNAVVKDNVVAGGTLKVDQQGGGNYAF